MRIEKLLRRYLCRELLQWTAADLCRAQKCSGAAVLLEIGQRIGRVRGHKATRRIAMIYVISRSILATMDHLVSGRGTGMPNRAARSGDLACCCIHWLKLWSTSALRSTGIHRERGQEIGVVAEQVLFR